MTERLYYTDSSILEFEAVITESGKSGDNFYTKLDKSAFYPTSGGQQHDIGFLNSIEIIDVIEHENDVLHISSTPIGKTGALVNGIIDKDRRLMNRQQHSAQHILSQSFKKLFDLKTVSVHLGDEYGNIELEIKDLTSNQVYEAEKFANQIIENNHQIEILIVDSNDLKQIPLRKPTSRTGKIRIIKIGDFEYVACGGTHMNYTSEILLIKIISTEKIRGRIAVNFICGRQAVIDYINRFTITTSISNELSCSVNDVAGNFNKLMTENRSLRRELSATQKEMLPVKADFLSQTKETIKDYQCVIAEMHDLNPKLAGQLAFMTADKINGITLLLNNDKLILAISDSVNQHAGNIVRTIAAKCDLKGGGSKTSAQLGGAEKSKLNIYKNILIECITNNEK